MADLVQQLTEYKLQLQQVEATLSTDPDNEDLQKLKHDLEEVINLTQELVKTSEADVGTSQDDGATSVQQAQPGSSSSWEVGDLCQAVYADDGQHYDAVIDEILDDGSCTVTFEEYGNTEVSQVMLLKPREGGKRGAEGYDGPDSKKPKTKKDMLKAQQEYKKKKNEKKRLRSKQLEEERETEKNKWLDFNAKAFSKTSKGKVKKSIFATPDGVHGRVGVGTCGIGGKPMTTFHSMEKWKK